MKQKVYITRKLPEELIAPLCEQYEVGMWDEADVPVPRDVLEKELQRADGVISLLTETLDRELLARCENLKVISNVAVGYNNIDVVAATERGIIVTNTPDVLTETTADLTFALMLGTARRLEEAARYLRTGNWQTWSPFQMVGQDVYGATLGIFGLGRIGEAVARRATAFGMEILYTNRTRNVKAEQKYGAHYVDKETLLKKADFVCVLMPYTAETVDFIAADELSLMKTTAILINTARGGIVNEAALFEALVRGDILAAGLDVFEREPVDVQHPLLTLPNVFPLPHIGSASEQTRTKMVQLAIQNLHSVLQGEQPKHPVNK